MESGSRIPELIRRAFTVAFSGRPGPVALDVPEDVCHAEHQYDAGDFWVDPCFGTGFNCRCRPDGQDVERAAELLVNSRRPVFLAGGGIHISGACDSLLRLVEDNAIPVGHTLSGKGAIPCIHPLSGGLFGRYTRIANDLIAGSDLLIVAGCKLGEIATKRFQLIPPDVPLVHLDIMPEEFGRTTRADVRLYGDARLGLQDLASAVADRAERARQDRAKYVDEIGTRLTAWKNEAANRLHSSERPINIARLYTELNTALPEQAILVTDGGFSAHWGGLLYDTKRSGRTFVANLGFASIGYGLPGAIGARLGAPDAPVFGVTGDAGFNMMLGELETARRLGLALTVIVVNNAASGYVKALQHLMFGPGAYQSSDLEETIYVPGSLAHSNILAHCIFSAISGSSVATAAAIAIPEMEKRGYDRSLTYGSLAAGGTLGILIPPSIPLILYGASTSESVGRLFIAGVMPGILLTALFILYLLVRTTINPDLVKENEIKVSWPRRMTGLLDILPIFVLMFVILGGIYLGVTTPTEAAAVGVVGTIINKCFNLKMLKTSVYSAVKSNCMILFIVVGAQIMSYSLVTAGIPRAIVTAITGNNFHPVTVFFFLCMMYLVLVASWMRYP